jgi:hypothetical protein
MMQDKFLLVRCDFTNQWNEGLPVAVFDTVDAARKWLTDRKNLREATGVFSSESTPVLDWKIYNDGYLHYVEYERSIGKNKLVIHPIRYTT